MNAKKWLVEFRDDLKVHPESSQYLFLCDLIKLVNDSAVINQEQIGALEKMLDPRLIFGNGGDIFGVAAFINTCHE